jgi:MDMPI-like protein
VLGRFTGTDPDDGTTYDEEDLSVQAADPGAVPAVVVSGTAADLAAWMWHRRDDAGICVEGDPAVAARFLTLLEQPLN